MKTIRLKNVEVPYVITKKNNKNTYFYFKKDGYIQVNLSRYQKVRDALDYIKKHDNVFLEKYHNIQQKRTLQKAYTLWGVPFETHLSQDKDCVISIEDCTISYDPSNVDHILKIKQFEREQMLKMIEQLHRKYQHQTIVSLKDVNYYSNYTTSRHGSCNPSTRTIRISTHLVRLGPMFTEYVFCHEIAHLRASNHSSDFYHVLALLLPNYKDIRHKLKKVW